MAVHIEGLREMTRAMEKAGIEVEDLKEAMHQVAAEATRVMQPHIPTRSGKLRNSARPNKAKGKAVVTIGRATVPYAGPIQYGWRKRNIKPARYVEKTDAVMDTRAAEILEDGWDTITRKHGLS